MHLPLNALRAFETAARLLSFTRAAEALHVTPNAVAAHVKGLEARLGVPLFRRLPRGLALTDEALALLPVLSDSFERIEAALGRLGPGQPREVLTLGVVGTYAVGWLLPRLGDFNRRHPGVDLRVMTHNNRVDLAGEGLDAAIRFGDGAWHGTEAMALQTAPLSPLCSPAMARGLRQPTDLLALTRLRSYRPDEWSRWFAAAGLTAPPAAGTARGPVFDSSLALAAAAAQGLGVALLPPLLFAADLHSGRLQQPFALALPMGRYWLTWLQSRPPSPGLQALATWLQAASGAAPDALTPATPDTAP